MTPKGRAKEEASPGEEGKGTVLVEGTAGTKAQWQNTDL
jgi:hypothetical protein